MTREIVDVDLFDVSPVTFPAYESTSTGLRGVSNSERDCIEHEVKQWRESRRMSNQSVDIELALAKANKPIG